eukprot:213489-Chlamydomonas_euryale.AAC.2
MKAYPCRDLGDGHSFLNMGIVRDHAEYAKGIVQKYGLEMCRPQSTLLSGPLSKEGKPLEPGVPYAELVGSLLYLMHQARSDLRCEPAGSLQLLPY